MRIITLQRTISVKFCHNEFRMCSIEQNIYSRFPVSCTRKWTKFYTFDDKKRILSSSTLLWNVENELLTSFLTFSTMSILATFFAGKTFACRLSHDSWNNFTWNDRNYEIKVVLRRQKLVLILQEFCSVWWNLISYSCRGFVTPIGNIILRGYLKAKTVKPV